MTGDVVAFPTPRQTIPDNPVDVANMLVDIEMMNKDALLTVALHNDKTLVWNDHKFILREKTYVQKRLIHFVDGAWTDGGKKGDIPFVLTSGFLSVAIKAVEARISEGLDHTKPLPQWRDLSRTNGAYNNPFGNNEESNYILSFPNGLVHLLSREHVVNTPAYVNIGGAEYEYDATASREKWMNSLPVWFGKDQESIDALQEAYGLSLIPNFRHERMPCIIGEPGIGKRMLAMILTHLPGEENVASATLQSVANGFGFENWEDKSIAIFRDARISSGKFNDIQAAFSMLLSIISGEPMPFNRKYKRMVDALLRTHVWYFSNEIPYFSDFSLAVVRRLLVIMMRDWKAEKDAPPININLLDELIQELPGILNWASDGLKRLMERGNFIQPKSGYALLKEIQYKSCPDLEFIDTHLIFEPNGETFIEDLKSQYAMWLHSKGLEH